MSFKRQPFVSRFYWFLLLSGLFHCVAAAVPSYAQLKNVAPNVLPVSDYGALCYKDGVLWAGGDALVLSSDLGITWRSVPSFPGRAVKDISFADKLHGVIGTEGALYLTEDGGASWHAEFVEVSS